MTRRNQILVALLLAQIAIAAFVLWPRSAPAGSGNLLISDFKTADVTVLRLSDKDGNVIELKKSGDQWVLPGFENFAADGSKITPVLDKIAAIKTNRLVARTDSSHKRLQVAADDFLSKVEFTLASGTSHTLFVGSAPGNRATHVRLDSQNEVYLADDLPSWELSPQVTSWVKTAYVDAPQNDIVGLTIKTITGTLEFTRDVSSTWQLKGLAAGELLDQNNITSLVGQVANLSLLKPAGKSTKPEFGLDKPNATLTINVKTADQPAKTITLVVGARDATDSSYFVKSSASEFVVKVSDFAVRDFITKTKQDFLQQPTPAPTPPDVTPSPIGGLVPITATATVTSTGVITR